MADDMAADKGKARVYSTQTPLKKGRPAESNSGRDRRASHRIIEKSRSPKFGQDVSEVEPFSTNEGGEIELTLAARQAGNTI
ncbi:hypothetical protein CYMTET_34918 [Cymbomonas tetramitiformis]|uniref:Uncharacterized protein n=1 Tax=Cymbomonas tetramitiformis TaxID=36881 RepID=A0AAE0FA50_9CHLO|nr:hypothetical protein CYMTET_34918 [Cymbomonas tetramitiformis]